MKRIFYLALPILALVIILVSCQKDNASADDQVPAEVVSKLLQMGFNPDGIVKVEEGYRIERDIIITEEMLSEVSTDHVVPDLEQYRTTNLVNAGTGRLITIYVPTSGNNSFSAGMVAAFDLAISRYNAEGLLLTFQRVTSSTGADITVGRLSKANERQGVLGSSGFPTASGNPYNNIKMSGILQSTYGLSTAGIATIFAHELGHCIGFRHTDYYNRAISCGGAASNEGDGGVGAILIPGTPSTATLSAQSWMLSCTDGSDRPFNNDDQTALDALY